MTSATELVPLVGVTAACETVGVGRASFYRQARRLVAVAERGASPAPSAVLSRAEAVAGRSAALVVTASVPALQPETAAPIRRHPRALSVAERQTVLAVLHSGRFRDAAPAAVYATLLDEGVYLASERVLSLPKDVPPAGCRGGAGAAP